MPITIGAEFASWLALNQISGLGNEGLRHLLQAFSSPTHIFATPAHVLRQVVKPAVAEDHPLFAHLGFDPVDMDSLCQRSGLTIEALSAILLQLELEGGVVTMPGGLYQGIN